MNNILKKLIYLVLILIVTTVVVEFTYRINYIRNIKKMNKFTKVLVIQVVLLADLLRLFLMKTVKHQTKSKNYYIKIQ